jgi:hypothetical protein
MVDAMPRKDAWLADCLSTLTRWVRPHQKENTNSNSNSTGTSHEKEQPAQGEPKSIVFLGAHTPAGVPATMDLPRFKRTMYMPQDAGPDGCQYDKANTSSTGRQWLVRIVVTRSPCIDKNQGNRDNTRKQIGNQHSSPNVT